MSALWRRVAQESSTLAKGNLKSARTLRVSSWMSHAQRQHLPSAFAQIRRYATPPKNDKNKAYIPPPPPKEKNKAAASSNNPPPGSESPTTPSAPPSKPAPGFENTFTENSPLSPKSNPPPSPKKPEDDGSKKTLLPGFRWPTKEEKDMIEASKAAMKRKMPKVMWNSMIFDDLEEHGVNDDMIKLFKEFLEMDEKGITMARMKDTLNTMMTLAKQVAEGEAKLIKANRSKEDQEKEEEEDEKTGDKEEKKERNQSRNEQRKQKAEDEDPINLKKPLLNIFGFKINAYDIAAMTAVAWILSSWSSSPEQKKMITWQDFYNSFLSKGLVEKLEVLNKTRVKVHLHRQTLAQQHPDSPAAKEGFHYYFDVGSIESFESTLNEAQNELGVPLSQRIPVQYSADGDSTAWQIFMHFGPTVFFVGLLVWLTGKTTRGPGGGGVFGVGRSRAKRFNQDAAVKVKFADVAGMDEAKTEIMEFVSFLKSPEQFKRLGAKIPRGAILSGPPGTGKTLLAKATAGETQVPFFSVSGSEFVEMFVGVGASRVRDLFAEARKNAPCIVFIDEIDAIGRKRSESRMGGGGNDEREATLNQILTEMDGFNTTDQIVVLAGTNRPDILDSALTRPGRFDRHIAVDNPTMEGRKQVFAVHLKGIKTEEDMEFLKGKLSALTPGFSGADIANAVNEAALIAARAKADSVQLIHFEQAIERVIGGLERKSLVLDKEERRVVAYHEAGHAICGWFFKYADPLLKVSIIPRGKGALGYAQYLPGDVYLLNVRQIMDRMAMTLGGRVSEELHFETVTSGASDDFNKVTRLATSMVTKWGMSQKIGYLHFEQDEQTLSKPFSEETARNIDAEVRRIVDEAYQQCRNLLVEKKKEVGLIAEELLSKEVLGREDMVRILGPRPFDNRKDFEKYFGGGSSSDGKETGDSGHGAPPPPDPLDRGSAPPGAIGDSPPDVPPQPAMFKEADRRL